MERLLKPLITIWVILLLLAIIFKIKTFMMLFPVIGTVVIVLLFVYTVKLFFKKEENSVDKETKNDSINTDE